MYGLWLRVLTSSVLMALNAIHPSASTKAIKLDRYYIEHKQDILKMSENVETSSNACVVCYKTAQVYSIGMCEHPVCFECSTRMRVLCQQNECPICRQDLPKVVFTREIKPFRFLRKGHLYDSKYNIYFDSPDIQKLFYDLLANKCSVCQDNQVFSSFNSLKDHMRRKHDLHFCDLCVDNLKIFSNERRCYTKADLSRHRRKGDADDKSHKGHPLCEFCDKRYMDNDELYRHLRRDHLFCHFCDADGYHHYYNSYEVLREHFSKDHFLCEEGNCADEQFTSVFRTEIDLKAHKANVHGKQLGKAAAKQARTLELEFTLAPRGDLRNRRGFQGQNRNHDGNANPPRSVGGQHLDPMATSFEPEELNTFVRQPSVDVASTEQFPTLGNASTSAPVMTPSKKGRGNFTIRSTLRKGNYDDNFPALGPDGSVSIGATATTSAPQQQQHHQPMKTLNFSLTSSSGRGGPAPRQPGASTPNLSIHVNHRPNGTVMTRLTGPSLRMKSNSSSRDADFPALGGHSASASIDSGIVSSASATTSSSSSSQSWTKVTCVKPEVMAKAKQSVQPQQKNTFSSPPPLRSGDDFPSLASKSGQSSKPTQAPSWVQVHSSNNSTSDATKGKAKKKKMKQTLQQTIVNGNASSGNESDSKKPSKSSIPPVETKEVTGKPEKSKKDSSKAKVTVQPTKPTTITPSTPAAPTTTPRKRAELKIDSLNTTNNNISTEAKTPKSVTREEDFPALGKTPSRPPGLASPPPGFTAPVTTAPPPGFISRVNGITFTNSSGESFAIVPDEADQQAGALNKHSYTPPSDFQKRNQKLIAEFNDCFGGSGESEQLKAFRYLSGLFRSGMCDADEYYKQCRTVMGSEAFKRVFPELLALLPDIDKQRELFKIHHSEASARDTKGLESCSKCGQILRTADFQQHVSSHTLENHFPVLGKSGSSSSASSASWPRK
ncbi:hypothetical protein QAD02_009013 [Eretmocerus hayati]|uniref:Uncharacterized protein n=1 Tax=Eretmocerus hayati TaxID=131215 RepID=A0ACC2N8X4_9HYME|nr:hypothetical protein QAD02_009013 [Eretmocerus hayati]